MPFWLVLAGAYYLGMLLTSITAKFFFGYDNEIREDGLPPNSLMCLAWPLAIAYFVWFYLPGLIFERIPSLKELREKPKASSGPPTDSLEQLFRYMED